MTGPASRPDSGRRGEPGRPWVIGRQAGLRSASRVSARRSQRTWRRLNPWSHVQHARDAAANLPIRSHGSSDTIRGEAPSAVSEPLTATGRVAHRRTRTTA